MANYTVDPRWLKTAFCGGIEDVHERGGSGNFDQNVKQHLNTADEPYHEYERLSLIVQLHDERNCSSAILVLMDHNLL